MQRYLLNITMGLAILWAGPLSAVTVVPLQEGQSWRPLEFRIDDVPEVANPFDPEQIRVDGRFEQPDGTTIRLPAFWYQPYERRLVNGTEVLTASGSPEWRLRFTLRMTGSHTLVVSVERAPETPTLTAPLVFSVDDDPSALQRIATVSSNRQYLATNGDETLLLFGHCVCWPGRRGTYDYDDWFTAMAQAGENYSRLWMWPNSFGIETDPDSLTQYRQDRAWQLDYVFQLAEANGIYLMLCLDYHGMFESEPDYWGGNNYWPVHPYNAAQGGPCSAPNDFFSNATAKQIYQKRLRYLIARYGYSTSLLAWQFFNEIDNVYRYLQPRSVSRWHAEMGTWLREQDPYNHLITTSLTGGSDRSDIWSLPQMDFAMFHSYNQPDPALGLSARINSFRTQYKKPMMIGEFGVNWQGWSVEQDPYRRALRQGVWTGLLGGSVGTSMSWWWESLHREKLYPLYTAIREVIGKTQLGRTRYAPLSLPPLPAPPTQVGELLPEGDPFQVRLTLNSAWGADGRGGLAIPNVASADEAPQVLNGFVHGTAHPELRTPFQMHLWTTNDAQLTLHLNSVSQGAVMEVRVDGTAHWSQSFPNLDGETNVNDEYNTNLVVGLPAGKHLVEVRNAGLDWFFLDWVEITNVLPATFEGGWTPAPIVIGIGSPQESLVYVAHPRLKNPAAVMEPELDLQENEILTLLEWPEGTYTAHWFDAASGQSQGVTRGTTTNSELRLPIPPFREDLVGQILPLTLSITSEKMAGAMALTLSGAPEEVPEIQHSTNLTQWQTAEVEPTTNSPNKWFVPLELGHHFFRATWR